MNAVQLNPNVPFVIKFNTDLLIGAIIRSDADGDPAKEAAKAQLVINVAAGFTTINGGDVIDGLAEIETAIGTSTTDPAEQAEISTVLAYIGSKAAAIQQALSGTISGALVSNIATQVIAEATAVANKYIPAAAKKPTT